MADLGLAIQRHQEALNATPHDHPDRASYLQSLGVGYGDRYKRTGAMEDPDVSIQLKQEALSVTPSDHPDQADYLHTLGIGYSDRYRQTGAMTDLNMSIQQLRLVGWLDSALARSLWLRA
jgi:hypothetical protein